MMTRVRLSDGPLIVEMDTKTGETCIRDDNGLVLKLTPAEASHLFSFWEPWMTGWARSSEPEEEAVTGH